MHLVEFSFHNIMTSSEKDISAALAQAFNSAQRYSPAILLLRHFDDFRNLAFQEDALNDQVGPFSEIASVIREFTKPMSDNEDNYDEETSSGDLHAKDARNIRK